MRVITFDDSILKIKSDSLIRSANKTFGLRLDEARKRQLRGKPGIGVPEDVYAPYDYSIKDKIFVDIKGKTLLANSVTISDAELKFLLSAKSAFVEVWKELGDKSGAEYVGAFDLHRANKLELIVKSFREGWSHFIFFNDLISHYEELCEL